MTDEATVAAATAVPRNWLIGGGVVLLVLLALWLGFTGFGGRGEDGEATEMAVIGAETTDASVATAVVSDTADVPSPTVVRAEVSVPTVVPVNEGGEGGGETAVANPAVPGEVLLPFVTHQEVEPSPIPTSTPLPTSTAAPAPTATAVPPGTTSYRLFLVKDGKTLFVVNQSDQPFPLADLQLVMDGRNGETISEWGRDNLAAQACVRLDKDDKASERPLPTGCNRVIGQPIEFSWKDDFIALFNGKPVADCDLKKDGCLLELSGG